MKMTVADLRRALDAYPPDQIVVVDGYEAGYDDPCLKVERVKLDACGESNYCGRHDDVVFKDCDDGVTKCLVISRNES